MLRTWNTLAAAIDIGQKVFCGQKISHSEETRNITMAL
jgi:hypothetical protein